MAYSGGWVAKDQRLDSFHGYGNMYEHPPINDDDDECDYDDCYDSKDGDNIERYGEDDDSRDYDSDDDEDIDSDYDEEFNDDDDG